jgi:hypothetical protein
VWRWLKEAGDDVGSIPLWQPTSQKEWQEQLPRNLRQQCLAEAQGILHNHRWYLSPLRRSNPLESCYVEGLVIGTMGR